MILASLNEISFAQKKRETSHGTLYSGHYISSEKIQTTTIRMSK